jgi:glycosyltransferase involved in cell wall biosynthesis
MERVIKKEKKFLQEAEYVFFTSDWALQDACKHYGLTGSNMVSIGQGPSTTVRPYHIQPEAVRKQFLMIATDFLGKGGREICRYFEKFNSLHPGYSLVIVGQRPPENLLNKPYIQYLGYINKSTAEGEQQLEQLYRESKAVLMMTRKDIAPLVIIEAGLQGCPSIANNMSAIGEMIVTGETGFLVNQENDMLQRMTDIAEMATEKTIEMRNKVQHLMNQQFNWNVVISKMLERI